MITGMTKGFIMLIWCCQLVCNAGIGVGVYNETKDGIGKCQPLFVVDKITDVGHPTQTPISKSITSRRCIWR